MTDYTTSVLSDVLAELRIGRDSTKGSLAEQVAHELRAALSRPTPTASAAPTRDGVVLALNTLDKTLESMAAGHRLADWAIDDARTAFDAVRFFALSQPAPPTP